MSDEAVSKLWSLVGELSDQLTQNRAVTAALQNQIAEIKEQAVHTHVGFPLRRFNTDLSQEEYSSGLEEFSTKLVLENRTLQHENKQLSILLREYEATLEGVMCKFRSLAHANATHELELHEHYSKALMAVAHQQGQQSLLESTQINTGLVKVGALLRKALRGEMGEPVVEDGTPSTSETSSQGGYLPPPSYSNAVNPSRPPAAAAAATTSASAAGKTYAQIGDSRLDWALEREAELVRLEEENRRLRELMGLDVDHLDPAPTTATGGAAGAVDDDAREGRGGAPAPAEKPVFGLSGGLRAADVLAARPETAASQ